ncbi:MAG: complex I NDUFA9 subunit family protein [Rickettsiales endosymbiont of Dermacentor nuttalli]
MVNGKLVTIFGGSGFIGNYIVKELASLGYVIRVVTRDPQKALYLRTAGPTGQVVLTPADVYNLDHLKKVVHGSAIVINLLGTFLTKDFDKLHNEVAENIARICKDQNVKQLIHISALVSNKAKISSQYAKSKFAGEKAVLAIFPNASIIRPSVVFGHEDKFFNKFAQLIKYMFCIPLIGGGKTKFQPVYVGDIAKAISKIVQNTNLQGKIYSAVGPDVITFKAIIEFISNTIDKKRMLLPIPFWIASLIARVIEMLSNPMITCDQVELLKYDNIFDQQEQISSSIQDIVRNLTSIQSVVPRYLICYK